MYADTFTADVLYNFCKVLRTNNVRRESGEPEYQQCMYYLACAALSKRVTSSLHDVSFDLLTQEAVRGVAKRYLRALFSRDRMYVSDTKYSST